MRVCERCRRPARQFVYGDFINESSYTLIDLCNECTKELENLIFNFLKNEVKNV